MMYEVPKKKTVSVKFFHVVFYLLGFLTLEASTATLSWNVSAELPLFPMSISQKSADLTWFGDADFGLTLHGLVQSNQVWRGLVGRFVHVFKTTSHI